MNIVYAKLQTVISLTISNNKFFVECISQTMRSTGTLQFPPVEPGTPEEAVLDGGESGPPVGGPWRGV